MLRLMASLTALAGLSASQSCGTLPPSISYTGNSIKPPDPFTFLNGTKVTVAAQWQCRREEISALLQRYELGPISAKPEVKASIPASIARITYNNEEIAATDPRGKGKFFDHYGGSISSTTGGLTAWAWSVSRILDALEQLGPLATKLDAGRVAVTGCSRNGKGAIVAGALDQRIRLTIPQEGGSGAMGSWRIAGGMKKNGTKVEDAAQIVRGDQWFAAEFSKYVDALDRLPVDHHMLAGMTAPRGLVVVENSGIDYLGPI